MSNKVYNNLLEQYKNLTMEEKRAILIYKSPLFNLMNAITCVPNFMELDGKDIADGIKDFDKYIDDVGKFINILFDNKNLITRMSIFNDIDFDNVYNLINCLKDKYLIMKRAASKISLCDDLVVYRGVSVGDGINFNSISRGDIISTSIKSKDTNLFLFKEDINVFYSIKLKKGTNVLVSPVSLVYVYKDIDDDIENVRPSSIKMINRGESGQEEVIVFKDYIDVIDFKYDDSDYNFISCYVDTISRKVDFVMDQAYYDDLASTLEDIIKNNDFSDLTTVEAFNCIRVLRSDNDAEIKKNTAVLANKLINDLKNNHNGRKSR